jgi:hypothetical protein
MQFALENYATFYMPCTRHFSSPKFPTDWTKGYLRLAKVLCLDGSFDKARDIYEYALQKLPAGHKGRDVSAFLSVDLP